VNLADLLNRLADDTAVPPLPEPAEILRAGDRRRVRARRRVAVAAAAVAVLAVGTTAAITRFDDRSAPQSAHRIDGWRITRTIEVPGNGGTFYGDRSLWVVDNKNGELTDDGTAPAGELYQIDPESGDVLDRVPGAVGGWPSVGAGAIWLSDVGLEMLTRVDLASHQVTRIAIHDPKQHPQGSAVAEGNLWVNNGSGDLLQMDPQTYRVRQTIHLGEYVNGEAPRSIITDGHSLWVSNDNGLVLRFDGTTGARLSRLQLPLREVLFDGIDTSRHVVYAHARRGNSVAEIDLDQRGTDWDGREVSLSANVDSLLLGFSAGPDSLWAATSNPDQLMRIDPDTFEITERMSLPGMNHESNVPVALTAGGGAIWIRIQDKVLQLEQDR